MDANKFFYDDSCKNAECCCKCRHMYILTNQITLKSEKYACVAPVYMNIEYNDTNDSIYKMNHPHGMCEMFYNKQPIQTKSNKKRV